MTTSIFEAANNYLDHVFLSRSKNTVRTYKNAVNSFLSVLVDRGIETDNTNIQDLPEDSIAWLADALKIYSPATEKLYLIAIAGFFEYLAASRLSAPNLPRIRMLIKQHSRRYGQRLPQFPREAIENIIAYAKYNLISNSAPSDFPKTLRNFRDRAFLITLAETGLRVHEACALRRGDIDWNEGKAVIIGKGDQQAVIRFSSNSLQALRDYLSKRSELDGNSRRPLSSLPVFARHDRGAGKKILPITTTSGRNIVNDRVREIIGEEYVGKITPHSFRHYFVTTVLRGSGGNIKLAQELARHRNITVTQRYAHISDDELDQGYWDIFEVDKS